MIYFPNKFEKYVCALRCLYQNLIIKNGVKKEYIFALKKIYNSEALNKNKEEEPINIKEYCADILTAVFIKKLIGFESFDFYISVQSNFYADVKIFTALLLTVCENANSIEIFENRKRLVFKTTAIINKGILKLLYRLNGYYLTDLKKGYLYLIFNLASTLKESRRFETAHEQLQNPLSPVNLYII